jgi:hypothetical protein
MESTTTSRSKQTERKYTLPQTKKNLEKLKEALKRITRIETKKRKPSSSQVKKGGRRKSKKTRKSRK